MPMRRNVDVGHLAHLLMEGPFQRRTIRHNAINNLAKYPRFLIRFPSQTPTTFCQLQPFSQFLRQPPNGIGGHLTWVQNVAPKSRLDLGSSSTSRLVLEIAN